jgi:hypothetical protein
MFLMTDSIVNLAPALMPSDWADLPDLLRAKHAPPVEILYSTSVPACAMLYPRARQCALDNEYQIRTAICAKKHLVKRFTLGQPPSFASRIDLQIAKAGVSHSAESQQNEPPILRLLIRGPQGTPFGRKRTGC